LSDLSSIQIRVQEIVEQQQKIASNAASSQEKDIAKDDLNKDMQLNATIFEKIRANYTGS
jgi:hypothetical protein